MRLTKRLFAIRKNGVSVVVWGGFFPNARMPLDWGFSSSFWSSQVQTTTGCETSFQSSIVEESSTSLADSSLTSVVRPLVKVAILGPPNSGKSTLFNRLADKGANKSYRLNSEKHLKTGRRIKSPRRFSASVSSSSPLGYQGGTAIVSSVPGTTRDRREALGRIGSTLFQIVDTAGVDGERLDSYFSRNNSEDSTNVQVNSPSGKKKRPRQKTKVSQSQNNKQDQNLYYTTPKEILRPMVQQALRAAQEAHLLLFMFDAKIGVTADFYETCKWIRRYATRPINNNNNNLTIAPHSKDEKSTSPDEHDQQLKNANHKSLREPQRVMLLANKLEGDGWDYDGSPVNDNLNDAARAGFGPATCISALHGEGISDIASVIQELQQELYQSYGITDDPEEALYGMTEENDEELDSTEVTIGALERQQEEPVAVSSKAVQPLHEMPLKLAILGRVNVGKSTLVNTLLREERVITGATPGLTRDAITIPWSFQGRPVQLVDTAGLRKPTKRKDGIIEDMAVVDAMRAMKVADVAILVLDAEALFLQRHELAICQTVLKEGRALVIVANKMDLVVDKEYTPQDFAKAVREQLEQRYPMLRHTPIVPMSSLTGKNVSKLMPVVFDARDRWERKISTGQLNRWLEEVLNEHKPPVVLGRPTKIKFMAQTKGRPPTFLLYSNTTEIPESYLRYLRRQFQESFDFYGMDVRFVIKKSVNPFVARLPPKRRHGFGVGGRKMQQRRMFQRIKEQGTPQKRPLRRRRRKQYKMYRN